MSSSLLRSVRTLTKTATNTHLLRRGFASVSVPDRKVATLGAAGGIGKPLALLMKLNPLVSRRSLYDIANTPGVAADVSHINTRSQVRRCSTLVVSPNSNGHNQQKDKGFTFLAGSLVKFARRQQGKHSTKIRRKRHSPKKIIFLKQRKGRMKGISTRGSHISFGRYALRALEPARITAKQIEAGRKAIVQNTRRLGGKLWVRMIPDKSVTIRPTETRMGRGKGAPAYNVAVVKPGRILYEIGGVSENIARKAISVAASKMPIRTQFSSAA